jgi:TonB family protein
MKAFILFAAGLLFASPANSETPVESHTASAKSTDPSIVNPKPTGRRHVCLDRDGMASWIHSTSRGRIVSVHLTFQVAADGTVKDVVVDSSSGDAKLDAYTIRCAGAWQYEPATKDGQAIDAPWSATVQYFHN